MSDVNVCVYIVPNKEDIPTDQKIRQTMFIHLTGQYAPPCVRRPRSADAILVFRTSQGKPYLPEYPRLHISVSYSGAWFVCAVGLFPIGIDLQEHARLKGESAADAAKRYVKIADRFFHQREADYVRAAPMDRFFSIWTAKESYVKFTQQGIDHTFSDFCVLEDPPPSAIGWENAWQAEGVWFRQMPFDQAYTLCLCSAVFCHWQLIHPHIWIE